MKIVAIVQARMGSTRLPGKIMKDLLGKPMLTRMLERLGRTPSLEQVVVATTEQERDQQVVDFCNERDLHVFRGSEQDVLDRYYQTAKHFQADLIVRCTSDCPLICPSHVEDVIQHFLANEKELDYVADFLPRRTFPMGLDTEVMTFQALERTWCKAKEQPFREHVTLFIYRHPKEFRLSGISNDEDLSTLRETVDTAEDLAFARKVFEHFGRDDFSWRETLSATRENPQWTTINAHIKQKEV